MKLTYVTFLIFIVCLPPLLPAAYADAGIHFSASGYGETQRIATAEAREQLAAHLLEHYQTQYCQPPTDSAISICETLWSASEIPLYGVSIRTLSKSPYIVSASLTADALPLYQQQLSLWQGGLRPNMTHTERLINRVNLAAHALVIHNLAPQRPPVKLFPPEAGDTGAKVNSLAALIKTLTAALADADPPLILPASYARSREITPFAAVLTHALRQALAHRANSDNIVLLRYREHEQQLRIAYRLVKRHQAVLGAGEINLNVSAIAELAFKPANKAFETVFDQATPVTDRSLTAHLFTNLDRENLLFTHGETLKLFVSLSQPGYFYLVGHVKQEQRQYSYLLDIGDREPSFVYHVDQAQAGHPITLGEFDIQAPYGTEYVQLLYSVADLRDQLPLTRWDEKLGYFLIVGTDNDITAGLNQIRGLIRLCGQTPSGANCPPSNDNAAGAAYGKGNGPSKGMQKPVIQERTLSFTTMDVPCANVRGLQRNCAMAGATPEPVQPAKTAVPCEKQRERGLSRNCQ